MQHQLSIIVVSDFEPGEKTWADEVAMAKALSLQETDVRFEVLFVESHRNANRPPPDTLFEYLPQARIVHSEESGSAELKDAGLGACHTPWVAVFEADAQPDPDWVERLWSAKERMPDYAIFSGRTTYGSQSAWQRALGLLDRSFDDAGSSGETVFISNNAALYRRDVLQDFRYPKAATPFLSSRERNRDILSAGHKCFSDRDALSRHAIGGLDFVWDVRKHTGYSSFKLHQGRNWRDIFRLTAARLKFDFTNAKRVGRRYLRPLDWAIWLPLFLFARVPEVIGMVQAKWDIDEFEGSAYR